MRETRYCPVGSWAVATLPSPRGVRGASGNEPPPVLRGSFLSILAPVIRDLKVSNVVGHSDPQARLKLEADLLLLEY